MGDKSPKSKQREKDQKNTAKATIKANQATRQASYASPVVDKKKK